jgi:hypothetical protein
METSLRILAVEPGRNRYPIVAVEPGARATTYWIHFQVPCPLLFVRVRWPRDFGRWWDRRRAAANPGEA